MKAFVAALAFIVAAQPAAPNKPSKPWEGKADAIEARLKTAEVVRIEAIGTGVTLPRRAYVQPAEPFESFTWKVLPPGVRKGFWESYKSEIAAYELDKLVGLDMIPPTVERTIGNDTGAAILWVRGVTSVRELGGRVPSGAAWAKPTRRMLTFDNFIANIDRNAGNILVGEPGQLILIDHTRAFTQTRNMVKTIERVDADLWMRIEALTREDLDRAVGPWLEKDAIDALLARRTRMEKDIEKLVSKKGRSLVIVE